MVLNDLNRIHKRALRIISHDFTSSYEKLLQKSKECTIHQRNLQKLMLEVYDTLAKQNPSFLWDMFQVKDNNDNLRPKNLLMLLQAKTTNYGNGGSIGVAYISEVASYGIPCQMI